MSLTFDEMRDVVSVWVGGKGALPPFDLWSPRSPKPSREFFVQQSVLNAMAAEKMNPSMLAYVTADGWNLPGWLEVSVCRQFRKLDEAWS